MAKQLKKIIVDSVRPTSSTGLIVRFDRDLSDPQFKDFQAGQHLALEAEIEGQAVRRCYSLASSPSSDRLEVGIRVLPDGKFSSWARDNLRQGSELKSLPPDGHFLLPSPAECTNLLFIACGSGITPILSMIEEVLAQHAKARVSLIYGNSSLTTMMFREEILLLKNRYPDRLQLISAFSQQEQEVKLLNGRVSKQMIAKLEQAGLIRLASFSHIYLCGPKPIISELGQCFEDFGIDAKRVHHELFLNVGDQQRTPALRPERDAVVQSAHALIKLDGRQYRVELDGKTNILEQALEQDVELPHSCLAGVCSSCRAKLVRGKVYMPPCDALEEEDIEHGYILTCQAVAETEEVEINFDV